MSLMKRLMAQKLRAAAAKPKPVDRVEYLPELDGIGPPVLLSEELAAARASAPKARGSCRAINAETGRQCALLGGHTGAHRHGRTEFWRVAEAGQTSFARRDALDGMAGRRLGSPFTTSQGEP